MRINKKAQQLKKLIKVFHLNRTVQHPVRRKTKPLKSHTKNIKPEENTISKQVSIVI